MRWPATCLMLLACGVFATPAFAVLDTDSDGVADASDNCASVANGSQADLDGDNVGDACDGDIDGDGWIKASDVFPRDASEHTDADHDGVGDNADTDDDNDTIADVTDNCPGVPNASQADL